MLCEEPKIWQHRTLVQIQPLVLTASVSQPLLSTGFHFPALQSDGAELNNLQISSMGCFILCTCIQMYRLFRRTSSTSGGRACGPFSGLLIPILRPPDSPNSPVAPRSCRMYRGHSPVNCLSRQG